MNFAVTDPPADVGSATTFTDASQALGAFSEFSARSPISDLELSFFLVVHPMRPNARRAVYSFPHFLDSKIEKIRW